MESLVTIVGAGALGSHLVQFARNWQVKLRVVDFDRVEPKNLAAQFHAKQSYRKNKAQALASAMQFLWGTSLEAIPHRLTSENAKVVLGQSNLVIDCTDNFEARNLIQQTCILHGIPCLHGCLSADGLFARMIWTENFVPDHEGQPGQATCEEGDRVAFYALVGAHLALTAKDFLDFGRKVNKQLTSTSVLIL